MATLICSPSMAMAVILYGSGDSTTNSTAPPDPGMAAAWSLQGSWNGCTGTPIAANYFLTAAHIGASVGDTFRLNGQSFVSTGFYDDPHSDMRIVRVEGPFASFASLYARSDEKGKDLFFTGTGTRRGASVTAGTILNGWQWGESDGVRRWGTNRVENTNYTTYLTSTFSRPGAVFTAPEGALSFEVPLPATEHEATVSLGDSGGGVFINDDGVWKLAGVVYAVQSSFSIDGTSSTAFSGAIMDQTGLFQENFTGPQFMNDQGNDQSTIWLSSRVSYGANWIEGIISVPEPSTWALLSACVLGFGMAGLKRFRKT